jgi:hypothetical protein
MANTKVLDEHLIKSIRSDDPEYDDKLLAGITPRGRGPALREAEDGGVRQTVHPSD